MHCIIVNFRASYEDGISIDSCLTKPWDVQRTVHDLLETLDDEDTRRRVFDSMPPDEHKAALEMIGAYQGMGMRARFNPDVRGPFVLYTDDPVSDEFLIEWAEQSVFKKGRSK